jgi:hydroxymethylglutaryl-CoA lyase
VRQKAGAAGLDTVVYISMAFGNPYEDAWNKEILSNAVACLTKSGVRTISLADTVGTATPNRIGEVVNAVTNESAGSDIGIHLHSTRQAAAAKILAAYDAGGRRFDSALGGLGGCPFAQNELVGNIPTEEILRALKERGVASPLFLKSPAILNEQIVRDFARIS